MSFSVFGDESSPRNLPTPNGFNYIQRHSPVVIEQNVSYTRGGQNGPVAQHAPASSSSLKKDESNTEIVSSPAAPQTEEDARFLRLAHDALVATSTESNLIVDPTIQDLLRRLQYVSSPHGNPIKNSESIRSNENGQLNIQNFYKGFPNLSNNIFVGNHKNNNNNNNKNDDDDDDDDDNDNDYNDDNNPASKKSEGWNFLLDKSMSSPSASPEHSGDQAHQHRSSVSEQRKFPCSGCSMSFRRSSDLKRHAKQHLSIPANICSQCGKGFARRDALKRHIGTMTCKRNAEKKLYNTNLDILRNK